MLFELGLVVMFEVVKVDNLLVAVVNIVLVAVFDKLEIDIQVFDKLAAALLASKSVDMELNLLDDLELGTGNWNPCLVVVVVEGVVAEVVLAAVKVVQQLDQLVAD
ncbi:hypothetical protein G9A89_023725 [Geosiphon pyriformis]|nr:hypothetical protein G9A89_023725 [Geosiphon pyriformis]